MANAFNRELKRNISSNIFSFTLENYWWFWEEFSCYCRKNWKKKKVTKDLFAINNDGEGKNKEEINKLKKEK